MLGLVGQDWERHRKPTVPAVGGCLVSASASAFRRSSSGVLQVVKHSAAWWCGEQAQLLV